MARNTRCARKISPGAVFAKSISRAAFCYTWGAFNVCSHSASAWLGNPISCATSLSAVSAIMRIDSASSVTPPACHELFRRAQGAICALSILPFNTRACPTYVLQVTARVTTLSAFLDVIRCVSRANSINEISRVLNWRRRRSRSRGAGCGSR